MSYFEIWENEKKFLEVSKRLKIGKYFGESCVVSIFFFFFSKGGSYWPDYIYLWHGAGVGERRGSASMLPKRWKFFKEKKSNSYFPKHRKNAENVSKTIKINVLD